jgi:metal transporter CNNM
MGQDHVHLQVISRSGTRKERQNALKVLGVLQRGRHWVLVSLLLGNVITNEALPIVLDREVKGGWFAVLTSALLIVIFGEIIPQSICAKYGLSVGSWASRFLSNPAWLFNNS